MQSLYPRSAYDDLERHVAGFALTAHRRAILRTLSTGTQRKVWLAAALAAGTRATLLDERLNALDAASHAYLIAVLTACARDLARASIVCSHDDLGDAGSMATMLDLSVSEA